MFTWVLSLVLFLSSSMVNTQMQGCSLQGIDLQHCLNLGQNSVSFDACCQNLNQALLDGYHCLCVLLGSSHPLPTIPTLLSFSSCFVSVPPLTQCREAFPVLDASALPMPAVNLPPPTAFQVPNDPPTSPLPMLIPPDIPKELPQTSASSDSLVPSPEVVDIPSDSTPNNNFSTDATKSTLNNIPEQVSLSKSTENFIKFWFCSRFLVVFAVYAFVH